MTFLNFTLVFVSVFLSLYYIIRGRKIDKGMMIFNLIVGLLLMGGYTTFFIDFYFIDFWSRAQMSMYIIKPVILLLLLAWISNIFRIGFRTDEH